MRIERPKEEIVSVDTNGDSSKVAFDQAIRRGVHEAFVQVGWVQPDGSRDLTKFREAVFAAIKEARVTSRKDRGEKAITRGNLMAKVFPEISGPDDWKTSLDQAVWIALDRGVWAETSPNANKALQRMVGIEYGNGYVLCRTKVGQDRTEAAYITDNFACIEQDFVRPDNERVERALKNATDNREMLVLRQPQNAKRYVKGYAETFQAA